MKIYRPFWVKALGPFAFFRSNKRTRLKPRVPRSCRVSLTLSFPQRQYAGDERPDQRSANWPRLAGVRFRFPRKIRQPAEPDGRSHALPAVQCFESQIAAEIEIRQQ